MIRRAALAVVLVAAAGCSSPPGPAPATPAPTLPADAIAYDDLLSTDRPFPFSNSCEQMTSATLAEVDSPGARDLEGVAGPVGCAVEVGSAELEELWIEEQVPPNPSEPRYFPLAWNGDVGGTYHRRLLLDGRYYAVELIDFYGGQPGCYLIVDPGSPSAIQFRGIVPEQYAASYGELNHVNTNYEIDHAGIERFMTENCPVVERMAVALLQDIDPDGGSLATG